MLVRECSLWVGATYEIQSNDIVVAFHGIEFDCEPTRVARLVRVFAPNSHGGETDEDWSFLAHAR